MSWTLDVDDLPDLARGAEVAAAAYRSFGQFLATNLGGIGLAHGGFNKFRSLAADAQSGALRITSTY
ncbi:hypothetical protein IAE22_28775 [Bacillus sp. S34]|nr:hypothetical protein [Bacillus sp. S34]